MNAMVMISMLCAFGPGVVFPGTLAAETFETTPGASPVANGAAWQVTDIRELEVDGWPFSLSPDGQWLAGLGSGSQLCVWAVADLAPNCAAQGMVFQPDSVVWAPDSTAVAFSHLGQGTVQEAAVSDILVFDVADGVLRNLTGTEDGSDQADTGASGAASHIDVYPAWSPDGDELVFARLEPGVEGAAIMRIDRDGGEPELVLADTPLLRGPIHWVEGDRIFYAIAGEADADNGIRVLNPDDGTSQEVLYGGETGEIHKPVLVDVSPDGSWLTVYASSFLGQRENDGLVGVVNTQSGEVRTLAFPMNELSGPNVLDSPRFSPDGQWLVALLVHESGAGTTLGFWQPGSDGPSVRISLEEAYTGYSLPIGLPWEEDTILLMGPEGGALLTMERGS